LDFAVAIGSLDSVMFIRLKRPSRSWAAREDEFFMHTLFVAAEYE